MTPEQEQAWLGLLGSLLESGMLEVFYIDGNPGDIGSEWRASFGQRVRNGHARILDVRWDPEQRRFRWLRVGCLETRGADARVLTLVDLPADLDAAALNVLGVALRRHYQNPRRN